MSEDVEQLKAAIERARRLGDKEAVRRLKTRLKRAQRALLIVQK